MIIRYLLLIFATLFCLVDAHASGYLLSCSCINMRSESVAGVKSCHGKAYFIINENPDFVSGISKTTYRKMKNNGINIGKYIQIDMKKSEKELLHFNEHGYSVSIGEKDLTGSYEDWFYSRWLHYRFKDGMLFTATGSGKISDIHTEYKCSDYHTNN